MSQAEHAPDQTKYIIYFDNMHPGQILQLGAAQDPAKLKQAAKDYADQFGTLQFSEDYLSVTKLYPWPDMESTVFGKVVSNMGLV